jgi:hypothetical protein
MDDDPIDAAFMSMLETGTPAKEARAWRIRARAEATLARLAQEENRRKQKIYAASLVYKTTWTPTAEEMEQRRRRFAAIKARAMATLRRGLIFKVHLTG